MSVWINKLQKIEEELLDLANEMFVQTIDADDGPIEKAIDEINMARAEIGIAVSQLIFAEGKNRSKIFD